MYPLPLKSIHSALTGSLYREVIRSIALTTGQLRLPIKSSKNKGIRTGVRGRIRRSVKPLTPFPTSCSYKAYLSFHQRENPKILLPLTPFPMLCFYMIVQTPIVYALFPRINCTPTKQLSSGNSNRNWKLSFFLFFYSSHIVVFEYFSSHYT